MTRVLEHTPGTARLADLRAAGFESKEQLAKFLRIQLDDRVYLVEFRYLGPELVKQPLRDALSDADLAALLIRLAGMDSRSVRDPWTDTFLRLIDSHPGTRAADLAASIGWETPKFKEHVRRLKKLGLTISLELGYKLSARGLQVLDRR